MTKIQYGVKPDIFKITRNSDYVSPGEVMTAFGLNLCCGVLAGLGLFLCSVAVVCGIFAHVQHFWGFSYDTRKQSAQNNELGHCG